MVAELLWHKQKNTAQIKKNRIAPTFHTILGSYSLKNKPKYVLKYAWKIERKKFSLKGKKNCYCFEEFNTQVRKVL